MRKSNLNAAGWNQGFSRGYQFGKHTKTDFPLRFIGTGSDLNDKMVSELGKEGLNVSIEEATDDVTYLNITNKNK